MRLKGDQKDLIATLKLAVGLGFDDASALDGDEFKAYRELPEFRGVGGTVEEQAAIKTQGRSTCRDDRVVEQIPEMHSA